MKTNIAWIMILAPIILGDGLAIWAWASTGDRLAAAAGVLLAIAAVRLVQVLNGQDVAN